MLINTKPTSLVFICIGALALSGCWGKSGKKKFRSQQNDPGVFTQSAAQTAEQPQQLRDIQTRVGVRNFLQIYRSMLNATGVSQTASVKAAYDETRSQMPPGNDIKGFNAANQLAIAKLAGAICNEFIDDPSLRSSITEFSFEASPGLAFTDSGRKALVTGMTAKFWGVGAKGAPTTDEVDAIVKDLVADLQTSKPDITTVQLSKGVCMSILSASPVSML